MKKTALFILVVAATVLSGSSITTTGGSGSSGGGGTWGSITGTLSSQTDLQTELDGKVNNTGTETIAGTKTFSSALSVPLGTVGSPGIYTGTDTNTGLYSPGADQIALTAGGAAKFISDSSGGIRMISSGNNASGHTASMSLSGGTAGAGGLVIGRGTYDTNMPGGVWYTATSPNGGTSNIGYRATLDGGTISSYGFGIYIENNVTNSSTSTFSPYNASGGNYGARFDISAASDTGQALGLASTGTDSKLVAGAAVQGVSPRDVSGNQAYGIRAHGARRNAAMTFPSQVVGVYGWITDTNSAAVEQRNPGISSAGIFDNGDTTANIFTAMDNGSSVLQVKDGGATSMQAFAGAPTTVDLTADNQSVSGSYSVIRLTSDNSTATNRTFVLADGIEDGQNLILEWSEDNTTGAGEMADSGNQNLSATWSPNIGDTIQLIWNSTASEWREISRSNN